MAHETPAGGKGLLDSLTTLAATLVAIARTRLELLSTDLEEERAHWLTLLVSALVAVFFLGMGAVLAAFFLVVVFWDTHRLLVLGLLTAGFLAVGAAAVAFAMHRARTRPKPFAASLAELGKDRQHLGSRS